jgi:hypothetical protein
MAKSKSAAAAKKETAKWKPPPVVCTSLEEADELLRQWQELDTIEAQAQVDKKAATKQATDDFKARLFVEFPEGKVSFADRRTAFESAIRAYAEKHRDTILLEKLKSRRLNYGELGWREAPDSIIPYAGVPDEGNTAVLEQLAQHLRNSLKSYKDLKPELLDCLTIDIAWSREALAKAINDKKLAREDLRPIGLRLDVGQDEFFCRPEKAEGGSVEAATNE